MMDAWKDVLKWGNDESGSDAVGCLAEALLWSFS